MLMEKYGHSTPSLTNSPQYKCGKCRDSGWIEVDPVTRAVTKCSCRIAAESEAKIRNSGLSEALDIQTFDSFITKTDVQQKMKEIAKSYLDDLLASDINSCHPWLYLGGNPGSGKTHICTAVCGELLKHNIAVRYMEWLKDAQKLKAYVNDENFDEIVSEYINISVLYIDDLFKQIYSPTPHFTDADIKIAFTILNARYIRNKPTIISCEWDLINQLLPVDEGVFSRVYERCKSYRMMIARKTENNFRLMG